MRTTGGRVSCKEPVRCTHTRIRMEARHPFPKAAPRARKVFDKMPARPCTLPCLATPQQHDSRAVNCRYCVLVSTPSQNGDVWGVEALRDVYFEGCLIMRREAI